MRSLCARGGLDPAKVGEATQLWETALTEVRTTPSYPSEERLFWLLFLLARHHAENGERPRAQQLLEATIPYLNDPRHAQIGFGLAARNAGAMGDHDAAARWAAQLDPRSEDLQIDTNYRFSVAYVALLRDDMQTVLQVLGSEVDDVPISDAYDDVCGVLRAHAHERLGRLDVAQRQLARFASSLKGLEAVQEIVQLNAPNLQLCPQSLPPVEQRVQQMFQNVIATRSGINLRGFFIIPILGLGAALGGEALESSLDPPWNEIVPGVLVGALVLVIIVLVFKTVLRGTMQRQRLIQVGARGTGQLLVIEQTGTRVNDQPMVRLRMLVEVPGREPYTVLHHEVVPLIRLQQLVPGSSLPVMVDPKDPTVMAVVWG